MKPLGAIICFSFAVVLPHVCVARGIGPDRIVLKGTPPMEVVIPAVQPERPIQEGHTGKLFGALCRVRSLQDGAEAVRFVVHVPDAAFLPFGQRSATFLALIWAGAERRWGRLCSRLWEAPINVWLTRDGPPGGEQVAANLYIYNLATERTGVEWARELAHEYGHYLLPAPSGYQDPESWPNGVLGERLFLKWLLEDIDGGNVQAADVPFVSRSDLADYCAKQVDPLLIRFRRQGPGADVLTRTDRVGFDAFTGMMLGLQDLYGPEVMMDLLEFLPQRSSGLRAVDFLAAFTAFADQCSSFRTAIPEGGCQVYLPRGKFAVRPEIGRAGATLSVAGCGVKSASGGWIVTATRPGWRRVSTGAACTLLWRRLSPQE